MKWIPRNILNVNIDVLFLCFFPHYNCVVYCKTKWKIKLANNICSESVATDVNAKSYNEIILMQIQCLINLKCNIFLNFQFLFVSVCEFIKGQNYISTKLWQVWQQIILLVTTMIIIAFGLINFKRKKLHYFSTNEW